MSRSDSWTFYDTTPSTKPEIINEVDKVSSVEEEILEDKSCEKELSAIDRTSYASNESHASIQNSLYENLLPPKPDSWQLPLMSPSDTRQQSSKSVLFEFDPFARTSEDNVYSNYENNDLMLLEALLATSDSLSRTSSTLELQDAVDSEEGHEDEELAHPGISLTPPEPPKRFDSLPKNEYDEVEGIEQPDRIVSSKNPPLLPKLAHLVTKKQPAVPPRKPSLKNPVDNSSVISAKPAVSATTAATTPVNNIEENVTSPSSGTKVAEDHRKVSVIQKLKKLRQESTVHAIKPNVISFVKTGSKFLSRTREHIGESALRSPRMERPKVNAPHNQVTHRGMVYR